LERRFLGSPIRLRVAGFDLHRVINQCPHDPCEPNPMRCCTNRSAHHLSLDSPRASRTPSDVRIPLIISGIWFGVYYGGSGIWTLDASYPGEAAFTRLSVSSSTTHIQDHGLRYKPSYVYHPIANPVNSRPSALHYTGVYLTSFHPIVLLIFPLHRSPGPRRSPFKASHHNNFQPFLAYAHPFAWLHISTAASCAICLSFYIPTAWRLCGRIVRFLSTTEIPHFLPPSTIHYVAQCIRNKLNLASTHGILQRNYPQPGSFPTRQVMRAPPQWRAQSTFGPISDHCLTGAKELPLSRPRCDIGIS
jgi:hypothetical protein